MTDVKVGDPIILVDNAGFEDTLEKGMLGWANSVTHVPGDGAYVFFMPREGKEMYVTQAYKVEVDEEAEAAGITLNEHTIAKG